MKSFGRWLGIAAALGAGLIFLGLLWNVIVSLPPEMDLWWHIPTVLRHVEGRSAWEILIYLFQPAPALFSWPAMKLFPWIFQGCLHWPFGSMILLSAGFHMANAGLVFWVGRRLGLSHRSCVLSALLFLTLFIHFHAYLWPMATQHVFVLFSILGALGLYLKTEEAMERNHSRRRILYGLTLWVAWAGSFQRAAGLVLLLIVTDILASSRSAQERGIRYDRWMPLFLLHPIYALVELSVVGDRVTTMAISQSGLPIAVKIALLFTGVLTGVAAGRWLVRVPHFPRLLGAAVVVGFLFLFPLKDKRQILFAYNALVPFASVLASFLDPFEAALRIDSTIQYYFIPAQISGFVFSLTVLFLSLFWLLFIRNQKRLWILFVWYAVCLTYVFLHPHVASRFPLQIVSRYFIFFTPVVVWVVSSVLVALFDFWARGSRMKRTLQGLLLSGWVFCLCVANLLAIRVAVFRGRFFNTYGIYDDIRVVQLIREDLERAGNISSGGGVEVYVNRMVPLDYTPELGRHLPAQGIPFDNLKLIASDALRGLPVRGLHVNLSPPYPAGARVFQVTGTRLEDPNGRSKDLFAERFEQGLIEYAQGRTAEADSIFQQAASVRPFLLRYLLGSCRLEDARWITGGTGLREWLEEIIRRYQTEQSVAVPKQEQTAAVVRRELFDYALCLLHVAYLKHQEGFEEESRDWLSRLRALEPDPQFLAEWLGRHPAIRTDPGMQGFLQRVRDPFQFEGLSSCRKKDVEFGSFLGRIIFDNS